MTFLQPFILFGLPLMLLPILIHLLNRLRHRPQPWGAMQFLLAAARSSVNRARLRQFLILLFRVLAVLALVLFLARPLVGSWLGWAVSTAPDVILLLADRSASMEHRSGTGTASKREETLRLMAESAGEFEEMSHLILIDSAARQPQTLTDAKSLLKHPLTTATDAAADIPAMLQSALSWLAENQAGNAEIWIGSDMQPSNWQAEDARWPSLVEKLQALPQTVKIRLLAMTANAAQTDVSLSLHEQTRRVRGGSREGVFSLDIDRSAESATPLPIEQNLDGVSTELALASQVSKQRWRHRVNLGPPDAAGWGFFSTPPDANNRNNTAYFVYGQAGKPQATVIAADPAAGSVLQIAAGNYQTDPPQPAALRPSWNAAAENWQDQTLLIWQHELPAGNLAAAIETFAREGGAVLFLPPANPKNATKSNNPFRSIRWGTIEKTAATESTANTSFQIGRWDQISGPLADTEEGLSLPLDLLDIRQRRNLTGYAGAATSLAASFRDGSPLLLRMPIGRGAVWFLTTLPHPDWSSLTDGNILIPLLQRLLQDGMRRQEETMAAIAGEHNPAIESIAWIPIAGPKNADFRWHAGIYQANKPSNNTAKAGNVTRLAINRNPLEDESGQLAPETTRRLFGKLPLAMLQEKSRQNEPLQGEAWRLFLLGMLTFLLIEGCLTLPAANLVRPAA